MTTFGLILVSASMLDGAAATNPLARNETNMGPIVIEVDAKHARARRTVLAEGIASVSQKL